MPRKKMPSLGTEDTDISQLHTTRSAEVLDCWARLEFSFAMDKDNSEPSHTGGETNETSPPQQEEAPYLSSQQPIANGANLHDAAFLAQIAAMPGLDTELGHPFFQFHPHFLVPGLYSNFFTFGTDVALNWLVHQQGQQAMHTLPVPTQAVPPIPVLNPLQAAPSHPLGETTPDGADVEQLTTAEEKRRRNTTASARFRMKKKLRTINLERSVADLTRRSEELQKEVSDLRRENGWLKEIVTLKGNHHTARFALSQAGQAAGIYSAETSTGQSSRTLSNNSTTMTTQLEEISSQGESEDDNPEANRKGKGKKRAKGKRK